MFVDVAGHQLAQAYAYDNGPDYFQEGYARIVDARKRIGFLDDHGRIAIAPQFDEAEGFCHGTAEVVSGGRRYAIDKAGKPADGAEQR